MLNGRWAKRILRAEKTEVISSCEPPDGIEHNISASDVRHQDMVKDNEKIMNYLQKENVSGHAHMLDMLLDSLNINYHLREAFLHASVTEADDAYVLNFPFGLKRLNINYLKRQ